MMTPYTHKYGPLPEIVQHLQDYLARQDSVPASPPAAKAAPALTMLNGDVQGLAGDNTVAALQGNTLTISSPATGETLRYSGSAFVNSKLDHGADLLGLLDDDHTQYALLAGRAGGQTLNGGTAASETLTLVSTAHATKGKIVFGTSAYDEVNNRLGIGQATPTARLHLAAGTATASTAPLKLTSGTNLTAPEAGVMEFDGTDFFLTPAATRKKVVLAPTSPSAYTVTNHTPSHSLDETAVTLGQLANVVGTLILELQATKIIG